MQIDQTEVKMAQKKQERRRVTVSMDPQVLATFKRMAEVLGISVGRAIGDWCGDTADGLEFVIQKMIEAKTAPARVMRDMQDMAAGMLDEVNRTAEAGIAAVAARGGSPARRGATRADAGPPRPVIRGESPPNKGATHVRPANKS